MEKRTKIPLGWGGVGIRKPRFRMKRGFIWDSTGQRDCPFCVGRRNWRPSKNSK